MSPLIHLFFGFPHISRYVCVSQRTMIPVLFMSLFPVTSVYATSRQSRDVKKVLCLLVMPLDFEKYRPYVDDFGISDAHKDELIQTVYSIMENFVDHAFGKHPVQQFGEQAKKILQDSTRILESKDQKEGSDS